MTDAEKYYEKKARERVGQLSASWWYLDRLVSSGESLVPDSRPTDRQERLFLCCLLSKFRVEIERIESVLKGDEKAEERRSSKNHE